MLWKALLDCQGQRECRRRQQFYFYPDLSMSANLRPVPNESHPDVFDDNNCSRQDIKELGAGLSTSSVAVMKNAF